MNMPFPGMDPYLEHPALWAGVHARLIVVLANQLQTHLDPRYVASVEERVFIEGPQGRIPALWVLKSSAPASEPSGTGKSAECVADIPMIVEAGDPEVRETRIEILDVYNGMKLVTMIEVVSPTNKAAGPGRKSYLDKQREALRRDCHLVEIDLLRRGKHVMSIPAWRIQVEKPYDYLACVNRYPDRNRYELYPRRLRQRLPRVAIPLADPDPAVPLDVQAALEQVYWDGRYMRRVRYDGPCKPHLRAKDQQ